MLRVRRAWRRALRAFVRYWRGRLAIRRFTTAKTARTSLAALPDRSNEKERAGPRAIPPGTSRHPQKTHLHSTRQTSRAMSFGMKWNKTAVGGACKLLKTWWPGTESNRRRQPFQGCALPTELPGRPPRVEPCHCTIAAVAANRRAAFRQHPANTIPITMRPDDSPIHSPAAPSP